MASLTKVETFVLAVHIVAIYIISAFFINDARGENILFWGDSHLHEINNNLQYGPVQYLERWGHTIDCECYGARGLHHWSPLEWQLPDESHDLFVIALMSNDIIASGSGYNYFDLYIHKLDAILNYVKTPTVLVLPTVFSTKGGAVTEWDVHIWRYFVAMHVGRNHPQVKIIDAERSGQQEGADGIHYDDAYLYARYLYEEL